MAPTTAKKSTASSSSTATKKTSARSSATSSGTRRAARGGAGAELTREQNAERGFTASETLGENLQKVLVDLIELSLQGKQAHWNVVGRNFRDTHLQLDEIIEAARGFADDVAERMRALHALPDGRSDQVAQTTTLPEFPQGEIATTEVIDLMTERLDAVAGTCRDVHDAVDEEDPTSADILHAILERVEQLSWMVSAENRTPRR
ncbi:DNA starvation/stationary phase protection protein [Microbacterium sp. CFH 90308]|uniref:DNA starvation/stationary phase protection protein n=1 Tax=Microbacterium salsuginis TaxID=2722803 RepID=A0ABX1K8Z4_9MICO|nr:DNA starvation/stationary phase protection protein [Microbacterium sp. CFH 90308]